MLNDNETRGNILVVDDDDSILNFIKVYIESEGYTFYPASDYIQALRIVDKEKIDLIMLDVLLPGKDGFDICQDIRKRTNAPIIFLSCKNDEMDIVMGLSVGGDDYITKPFLPGELMARINSNLRRSQNYDSHSDDTHIITYDNIRIDLVSRDVYIDNKQEYLLPKEFDILVLFIKNPKRLFSKEDIFQYIWKDQMFESDINTVTVHISNLRKKINQNPNKSWIVTIKGMGYKFAG